MVFQHQLVNKGHVRRLIVERNSGHWNVREEEDAMVVRETQHDDWHRVERAIRLFENSSDGNEP